MAKQIKKRPYKKRVLPNVAPADTFTIEEAPPPITKGYSPQKMLYFEKLERTLKTVKTGQAFIIPAEHKHLTKRYLAAHYANEKFSFQEVYTNPDFLRVYRLQYAPVVSRKTKY